MALKPVSWLQQWKCPRSGKAHTIAEHTSNPFSSPLLHSSIKICSSSKWSQLLEILCCSRRCRLGVLQHEITMEGKVENMKRDIAQMQLQLSYSLELIEKQSKIKLCPNNHHGHFRNTTLLTIIQWVHRTSSIIQNCCQMSFNYAALIWQAL